MNQTREDQKISSEASLDVQQHPRQRAAPPIGMHSAIPLIFTSPLKATPASATGNLA
jgi:hypothetical protein